MNRMQKHNLYNIKRNFEKKTGTRLISAGSRGEKAFAETAAPRKRLPRVALIAAILTVFVTLTAFAVSIFSTWAGDSLTITASYYGSGSAICPSNNISVGVIVSSITIFCSL